MTGVRVIIAGRIRESYLREGFLEYSERLKPHARVELVELRDPGVGRQQEGAREILGAVRPGEFLVVLDRRGRMLSSEDFARWLEERLISGQSRLAFVIGGPDGLPDPVLKDASLILSLGPMTLPHQMVPLVLIEQLYRAFKIISGEPYHR